MEMCFVILIFFIIECLNITATTAQYRRHGKYETIEKRNISEDCSACGIRLKNVPASFVRGGTDCKDPSRFPWLVQLKDKKGENHCGGMILSRFYILTAAHCATDANDLDVYFQTSSMMRRSKPYAIEKFIIHPNYSMVTCNSTDVMFGTYDIALLKLKEEIKCDGYKNAICLPDRYFKVPVGAKSIIAGWGRTDETDNPIVLQQGCVKHLKYEECCKIIPGMKVARCHMICAGGTNQTPCFGDSGGPLMHKIRGKFNIVGIVSSHTQTGCDVNHPAIYTEVAHFVHWIKEKMQT